MATLVALVKSSAEIHGSCKNRFKNDLTNFATMFPNINLNFY